MYDDELGIVYDDECWSSLTLRTSQHTEASNHHVSLGTKGPYPLEPRTLGRFSHSIGGQILNMFNTDSRPTLWRIGR